MAQPCFRAAASSASWAAGAWPRSGAVKKSRSSVGRVVRCCASRAAPPPSKNPLLAGRLKNSLVTSSWKSVRFGHADPSRGSLARIYAAIPRDAWITGAHADRTARGSTRSSHRSTSSAPSTKAMLSAGRPSCSTTSYTRAVGPRAQVEYPSRRRPVQVQRQPHRRERVCHVQARQVIGHPHRPAPRGGLPGKHHLRFRGQLIPGLRKEPGESCHRGRLPAILICRQRGPRRARPPGKLVLGQASAGPGALTCGNA